MTGAIKNTHIHPFEAAGFDKVSSLWCYGEPCSRRKHSHNLQKNPARSRARAFVCNSLRLMREYRLEAWSCQRSEDSNSDTTRRKSLKFLEALERRLFWFLLEHPGDSAKRILLPRFSSYSSIQQAPRHSFYVRQEFGVGGSALDKEWDVVCFHFEIERVGWTYRSRSAGIAKCRHDQANVVGARALRSDMDVCAKVLNGRILLLCGSRLAGKRRDRRKFRPEIKIRQRGVLEFDCPGGHELVHGAGYLKAKGECAALQLRTGRQNYTHRRQYCFQVVHRHALAVELHIDGCGSSVRVVRSGKIRHGLYHGHFALRQPARLLHQVVRHGILQLHLFSRGRSFLHDLQFVRLERSAGLCLVAVGGNGSVEVRDAGDSRGRIDEARRCQIHLRYRHLSLQRSARRIAGVDRAGSSVEFQASSCWQAGAHLERKRIGEGKFRHLDIDFVVDARLLR